MYKIILFFITINFSALAIEVVNMRDGKKHEGPITEFRNAFKIDPKIIGSDKASVLYIYSPNNPTSETFLWGFNHSIIGIGVTKIRNDYPQNYKLLKSKVYPKFSNNETIWKGMYSLEWEGEKDNLIMKEINTSPGFEKPQDLQFLIKSNGVAGNPKYVRIDRHFVHNGYYFQVVSLAPKKQLETADKTSIKFVEAIKKSKIK